MKQMIRGLEIKELKNLGRTSSEIRRGKMFGLPAPACFFKDPFTVKHCKAYLENKYPKSITFEDVFGRRHNK